MTERAVVCGGRVGTDERACGIVLAALVGALRWGRDTVFIDGCAAGYDTHANRWAERWSFPTERYRIDPELDGEAEDAPKRRNDRMRLEGRPTACVAFPGGPGTRHMWMRCFEAGIPVYSVTITPTEYIIDLMQKGQAPRVVAQGRLR